MLGAAVFRPRNCNELAGLGATPGSEAVGPAVCPPVVEYTREFQAWAAGEIALLPDRSAFVEMMGGYAVMREQALACSANFSPLSRRRKAGLPLWSRRCRMPRQPTAHPA